jgi:hypothetical protein
MLTDQQLLKELLLEKKRIRTERARVMRQFKMMGFFMMLSSAIGAYQTF